MGLHLEMLLFRRDSESRCGLPEWTGPVKGRPPSERSSLFEEDAFLLFSLTGSHFNGCL